MSLNIFWINQTYGNIPKITMDKIIYHINKAIIHNIKKLQVFLSFDTISLDSINIIKDVINEAPNIAIIDIKTMLSLPAYALGTTIAIPSRILFNGFLDMLLANRPFRTFVKVDFLKYLICMYNFEMYYAGKTKDEIQDVDPMINIHIDLDVVEYSMADVTRKYTREKALGTNYIHYYKFSEAYIYNPLLLIRLMNRGMVLGENLVGISLGFNENILIFTISTKAMREALMSIMIPYTKYLIELPNIPDNNFKFDNIGFSLLNTLLFMHDYFSGRICLMREGVRIPHEYYDFSKYNYAIDQRSGLLYNPEVLTDKNTTFDIATWLNKPLPGEYQYIKEKSQYDSNFPKIGMSAANSAVDHQPKPTHNVSTAASHHNEADIENIDEFMIAYKSNIAIITEKTHKLMDMYEEGEDYSMVNCWMVVDAIVAMLTTGKPIEGLKDIDGTCKYDKFYTSLISLLKRNLLIQISQDKGNHWFCIFGFSVDKCYIVQYYEDMSIRTIPYTRKECIDHLFGILTGILPDDFYGKIKNHTFDIYAYNRKKINRNVVEEYLKS